MAIKFSQFNLRTDHTSGMYLVGYDGNQNIHITVDNLFDDFINGTENTIAMFGTNGTVLADSILSQDAGATLLTVAGQLNVNAAATFDTSITVTGDSTLNGNVTLGDASTDLITQTGTLYLNGPVKDTTDTLGAVDQVLLSDATGELTFTDLADLHVGGAEVVEVPVKNMQGSALVKGDPVYISGSVGASGRLEVQLADASNTLKMPAVGLLKQDLADNEEGFAVVTGKLRNLITDPIDGVTPTENDVIYVKPSGASGAALTTTKPVYGNFIQNIGKVGRVSASNDGNFVVSSILRTNDIPNLTPGRLWIGSTGNTIESQTLFVDEANGRLGINEASPGYSLDVDGTLQTSGWAYFATSGPTSIAQLGGASTTTSQFNIATAASGGSFIAATNTLTLKANNLNAIEIDNTGELQFNQYGTGAFTGTATKNLSVDGFGNVIETNPAIDGSGTLNYVTKWTPDGDTLGNSIIFDNGTQVGIGTSAVSTFKLTVAGGVKVDGSNLNITNVIPAIYLNSSNSNPDWSLNNQGGEFSIRNNTLSQKRLTISSAGQVGFTLYGQNTFTGTAAKNLSVTSSGAIIETDAVPANIVETITTTDGTYINLTPNSATDGAVTVTADLSAVNGTAGANERYLTKNNTWAEVATIPGTYTWSVDGDLGTPYTVNSGNTVDITGSTYITTSTLSGPTLAITHDNTARNDTASSASPGYGGTFTVVDSVSTNATGHLEAINVKTVTMPSADDTNTTYDLSGYGSTNGTAGVQLVGSDSTTDQVAVTGAGTTTVTHSANTITVTSNDQYTGTVTGSGTASVTGGQIPYWDATTNITGTSELNYSTVAGGSIGRVGIGNSNATAFSDSRLVVGSGSGGADMTLYGGGNNSNVIAFANGTSGNAQYRGQVRYNLQHDNLEFLTNGETFSRVYVDSAFDLNLVERSLNFRNSWPYDVGAYIDIPSNNQLSIGTNGSERVRIDSSGNVLINNTSTYGDKLVVKSGNYDGTVGAAAIRVYTGSGTGSGTYHGAVAFAAGTGAAAISAVQTGTDSDQIGLSFWTHESVTGTDASVERMRIDSSGNVKINNGSLELGGEGISSGYVYSEESLYFNVDSNNTPEGSVIVFGTGRTGNSGGTELMRINSSGNVGIGTTNPQRALQVSTTGSTDYQFRLGTDAYYYDIGRNTSNGFLYFYGNQSNASGFVFETANGERMRIDHDGNVGIGIASPASKLDVNGGIRMADDSSAASASNVGTLRYRTSGNNSYVDMCMQTGASTYAWVNIVQNNW